MKVESAVNKRFSILRALAVLAAVAGAIGSAGLTLQAGRNNNSYLLRGLFVLWVLSPFLALLFAGLVSRRSTVLIRLAIYSMMPVITTGSLLFYSGVVNLPGNKPAFIFLAVPLVSWLFIAIVFLVAAARSRRLSRTNERVRLFMQGKKENK